MLPRANPPLLTEAPIAPGVLSEPPGRGIAANIAPFIGYPAFSSAQLMPIPEDPTDLQTHVPTRTADLGEGIQFFDGIVFRAGVQAQLNAMYDTGVPDDASLRPSGLALKDSDAARRSGIFDMTTFSGALKTDFQIPSNNAWPQAYLDLRVTEDDVEDRHAYARVGNLLGGEYYTTFSDFGALPESIVTNAAPAGFVSVISQVQLMYLYRIAPNWSITPAIARPNTDDFTRVSDDDVRLRRWPDFITRLRYRPSNYESAQVAVLVRQMGYEDKIGAENFVTGWGVAGNMRFRTRGFDNICVGVVGGQGLGDYLFGLSGDQVAAAPTNGELAALNNMGIYAGYQAVWTETLVTTIAYGLADVETRPDLADNIRNTQNGWVNLVWAPADKVAVGLEYQYGFREIQDGTIGDNHHVQVTLSVTMAAKSAAERARSAAMIEGFRGAMPNVSGGEAPPAMSWERM
jgi:hypothetical protein